jgi:hypothetical protein
LDKLAESIELSKPVSSKDLLSKGNGSELIPEFFFPTGKGDGRSAQTMKAGGIGSPNFSGPAKLGYGTIRHALSA